VDTVTRLVEAKSEQEALNRAANQQRALGFIIKEASVVKSKVIKEEAEQIDEGKNEDSKTHWETHVAPLYKKHGLSPKFANAVNAHVEKYGDSQVWNYHGSAGGADPHWFDSKKGKVKPLRKKSGYEIDESWEVSNEEAEQIDEELDQLSGRFLVSTDPSKQRYLSTERGKKNAAKKNVANLKYYIKHSLGKHPKPNLPEEADQDMSEAKYFKTAYGYAGGSKPSGGTYKHPERIKADKEKEKKEKQNVTEAEREAGYKMSPAVKAAQAKSDALSKVKKPAQAGTLAAKKQNMEEEKANVNASKVKLRTLKDKISNRLKTVNMNPTIDSGKL
jgi:hypothetical protein